MPDQLPNASRRSEVGTHRPGFLGIGAPRSGTTWLHSKLATHPEIWLPPLKELHYWDVQRPGAAKLFPHDGHSPLAVRAYWRFVHTRMLFLRMCRRQLNWRWGLRYGLGWRSDRWYSSLFPTDRLSGEITPAYMLLTPPLIESIVEMNPEIRVIFLLREPVSRAWSNACHHFRAKAHAVPIEKLRENALSSAYCARGNYAQALETWWSILGRERVFVGYYDDLVADPCDLLRRVYSFLGVTSDDRYLPDEVEREVNAAKKQPLPPEVAREIASQYVEPLRRLTQMLDGPPARWLAHVEKLAQS